MKNKYILGAILGILLIGVVSASITGYIISGNAISADGYRAEVLNVDRSGVTTVRVEAPTGEIKTVTAGEGESVKVGEAEISISNVNPRAFLRRGGAEVSLNISVGPAPDAIPIGKEVVSLSCNLGTNCYQNILSMLNNAQVTSFMNLEGANIGQSCNNLCNNTNTNYKTCVTASFEESGMIGSQRTTFYAGDIPCNYPMYNSSFGGTTTYTCRCI